MSWNDQFILNAESIYIERDLINDWNNSFKILAIMLLYNMIKIFMNMRIYKTFKLISINCNNS